MPPRWCQILLAGDDEAGSWPSSGVALRAGACLDVGMHSGPVGCRQVRASLGPLPSAAVRVSFVEPSIPPKVTGGSRRLC